MESKVKQVIIVEGKHDIDRLSSLIDADFIKTDGTSLPPATKEMIKELVKQGKEFIIFTDPDSPGERIRKELQELIPNAKHAFVDVDLARYKHKVGVEHAGAEEIKKALDNLVSFESSKNTITSQDLFDLGLIGSPNSAEKRDIIEKELRIGHGSGKTFLKRLNLIGVNREMLIKTMKGQKIWEK
jgi:ribonuclease M5